MAKRHFSSVTFSIKRNNYVLIKAVELISLFDSDFVDFFTEYLRRVPSEKTQIKQLLFQFVIRNEVDDERIINFLKFLI